MQIRHLTLLVMVGLLGACANPMLRIEAAGYSAGRSSAPAGEPASMAQAIQKLNHVRAAYHEAIVQQTGLSQDSVTGLVWLGTAIAGMAAGGVHRDGILGASLIGGTAYGLARTQLDARRLDIWISGMEALDCAREASLPLDIGADREQRLRNAMRASADARDRVQNAVQTVRSEIGAAKSGDMLVPPARETADKAELAAAEAEATEATAAMLLAAVRGQALSATVDRVHTGVTKAMKEIAVDPRAIKQLVAGVGGFAEVLAPGTGIEAMVNAALADYAKKTAGPAGDSNQNLTLSPLPTAVAALEQAMRLLAAKQKTLLALVDKLDKDAVAKALLKCGVAAPPTALALKPPTLRFEPGVAAAKGFVIEGGTPPYEVAPLDALPEGMVPVFRGGLADTVQIRVGDKVPPDDYRILVGDAGGRKQSLVVTVGARPATEAGATGNGADTGGSGKADAGTAAARQPAATTPKPEGTRAVTEPGTAASSNNWQALRTALLKPSFSGQIGPVTFTVAAADQVGRQLKVRLQCSKPNAGLKPMDVREKLAASNPMARNALRQSGELSADLREIDLSPSGTCIGS